MSLPWFPFYVDDFMGSPKVQRMTMEEIGVYVMLLCQQHQEGAVEWPCERIANALRGHERSIEYVLAECFEQTPEGWKDPGLSRIQKDQKDKSSKARMAAKARWDKGSGGGDANALRTHVRTQSGRNANQNQSQIQKTLPLVESAREPTKPNRKKRSVPLPEGWSPNEAHRTKAKAESVDVDREASRFTNHHLARDSRFVDWDRAFHTWLDRAREYAPRNGNGNGTIGARGEAPEWGRL